MSSIRISEKAALDIQRGREFYNGLLQGLGQRFTDAILSDLNRLSSLHGIHSKHFGFHRMLAERFPYAIYYLETEKETLVFAILDLRRDPSWIREKLGGAK